MLQGLVLFFQKYPALYPLYITVGLLGIVGISSYRLLVTDTQDDLYAPIVIGLSIVFNCMLYSFYFNRSPGLVAILLLFVFLNPIVISGAILVVNHSDLADKELIANYMWVMNICGGFAYFLLGYLLYAMALG